MAVPGGYPTDQVIPDLRRILQKKERENRNQDSESESANYAGQTSLYLDDPALPGNPFFRLVPEWAIYPMVLLATLGGMALGGWMSGLIFDLTGSYQAAFVNGLGWNLINVSIVTWLLFRREASPTPGLRLLRDSGYTWLPGRAGQGVPARGVQG